MKKLFISILTALMLLSLSAPAFALEMSEEFYVNDSANILSPEVHEYICSENYRLYDMCKGTEVVVVTVDFLGGLNAEEYSYEVFNDWALGNPDEDNGVLLLLCPGEEKYWLMSGTGLSSALSAGKLQTVCQSYIEKPFDAGDYDKAALEGFKAVVELIDQHYGVSSGEADAYWNDVTAPDEEYYGEDAGGIDAGAIIMVVAFIIMLIVVVSFLSIGRTRTYSPAPRRTTVFRVGPTIGRTPPPRRSGGFFGSGSTTRRSSSGMGSFGGGSSSRSSSSRSSFGGGSSRSSFGGGGRRGGGGGGSRGGGAGRR